MNEYGETHVYVDEITIINIERAISLVSQRQLSFFIYYNVGFVNCCFFN